MELDKVVVLFSTCVDLLKRLYKSIPKNAFQANVNLTFKPSRDKKASLNVPLNLHAQLYSVGKAEKDMTEGKINEKGEREKPIRHSGRR